MQIDPITLELMYHKFKATTEEMGIALGRTARSSYVRETNDFGTALCDLNGRFFAYPQATGISLGVDQDCSAFIAAFDSLEPGDILVTNHPYAAPGVGSHLPDINLLQPYFHEGEIVCFGWTFAHCADIGGGVPSSISPSFQNIFQEGLQIPPLKLAEKGIRNPAFTAILRANSRIPDIVEGDLQAQLSALAVGERRVAELVAVHGLETVRAAQSGVVEYARRRASSVLERLTDGTYEFHDYLDDDYHTKIPVRLRCRMTIDKGTIHLDLTGTDPQLLAPYNVPTGGVRHPYLTTKLMHMLYTFDPELPLNYGIFENITVHVPKGTVMNPEAPAAVGIRHAGAIRFNDAVQGCLLAANPAMAAAASGGTVIPAVVAHVDPASGGQRVAVVQGIAGGGGGSIHVDGADGRDRSLANIHNTPSERSEADLPLQVVDYALRPDSGGAGKRRGGHGVVYSVKLLEDGMEFMGRGLERFVFQPWGAEGGLPGEPARVVLNMGTPDERDLGKIDKVVARAGDVITIMTPGGGGYGDPFEREVARVADDVARGLVSREAAKRDYGVVLDEAVATVDEAATKALRASPRTAHSAFCPARQLWEQVFDDEVMTRMSTAVLALPSGMRHQSRAAIFAAASPAIVTQGPQALATDGFDMPAARARVIAAIEEIAA
ncbi:hydantoinase B/oxoprolinase family protein [Aurantiacibacter suaedae]|uniref:hydantoinase B/oxoprolinase family protein n=1 Tax=Aurantiacibacter suaedae TaxID=2545755 RepID=UPI0010F7B315|nr:hydantoinase B/oxoprolinase family protein [Aurantiacibacter suaedae]